MPTNKSNGRNDTSPVQFADIVGDDGAAGWETPYARRWAGGEAALHSGDVDRAAERRHFRIQSERRHGLAAVGVVAQAVPGPEHHRRPSCTRRISDCARIPHRSLGAQRTCPQRGRGVEIAQVGPFAAFCSDPCDGRTQGTPGMFDSLPYRNDAAQVMRSRRGRFPPPAG